MPCRNWASEIGGNPACEGRVLIPPSHEQDLGRRGSLVEAALRSRSGIDELERSRRLTRWRLFPGRTDRKAAATAVPTGRGMSPIDVRAGFANRETAARRNEAAKHLGSYGSAFAYGAERTTCSSGAHARGKGAMLSANNVRELPKDAGA